MWHEGTIGIPMEDGGSVKVRYQAKVYDTGSQYGINGGRISKLLLLADGECVAAYDRGWSVKPTCEAAKLALSILMNDYKDEKVI